jgi:signal transduction histidine kinase
VYLLKIELRGPHGQRVNTTLPCPRGDLNRWLAASQGELSSGKLSKLIRSNPTLLLIAVSRSVDCTGAPIQSMVQLLSRLDHCFLESNPLETAMGHVQDVQPLDAQKSGWDVQAEAILGQFLHSKKRSTLVKSLVKFVRHCNKQQLPKADRPKKSAVKSLIDSMFVDSFRIRSKKGFDTNWSVEKNSPLEQSLNSVVLGLLQERQRSEKEFDRKLLDAKLAAMKQLAYGASHEINNPLANVATRAHTMLAGETNPDRRFQLAVIHEQAMRAHDMISDMMLFAHPPKLNVKPIDIRLMVSGLVRECESNMMAVTRSGATIVAKVSKEVDRATIDPTHCRVALASLIQNAAEAIRHDHGEIEIQLRHDSGDLCITVSDNGVGIDDQVQQHLFDPFYSGREAGRGLGFGLSKCWRIAKLHGGSLTHRFDGDTLQTVFELRLPLP